MKKTISTLVLLALFAGNLSPVLAVSVDSPSAPTAPSLPVQPTTPPAPTAPPSPQNPFEPSPTPTPKPAKPTTAPEPVNTSTPTPLPSSATTTPTLVPTTSSNPNTQNTPTPTQTPSGDVTGSQTQLGGTGDNSINTGNANNSSLVVSEANTNSASSNSTPSAGTGIQIANTGNGSDSQNQASVAISENNQTYQINDATAINTLNQQSISGDNSVAYNTNGDSSVRTGDANVSATAITSLNTNTAGVSVSEFNIIDDHRGDYVLDFAANCISGCTPGSASIANNANGSGSNNTSTITNNTSDLTFQSNDATVGNSLTLAADSGNNTTSFNTNGDSSITTGDANVSANVLTFANNNLEGNVVYGVVNIYGDLVGDIIFPEEAYACCGQNAAVANTGNGANSNNQASTSNNNNDLSVQTNNAIIENNLILNSQTGANDSVANTGGSSKITTGDSSATAQVLNIANTNISGDAWLVLVNNAGNWTGQIVGANGNFAGSLGMQFNVTPSGEIAVTNTNNGSDSTNQASVSSNTDSSLYQSNTALIQNNLDLSANTGNNKASFNTGGDSKITTGDANIVANLVNFVNNNITGGGKLFVTVVNVFGSWAGNLLTPGQQKPAYSSSQAQAEPHQVGGAQVILPTSTPEPAKSQASTDPAQPTPTSIPARAIAASTLKVQNSNQTLGYVTEISDQSQPELGSTVASINQIKNPIRVNLAWILIFLPIIGILLIRKVARRHA